MVRVAETLTLAKLSHHALAAKLCSEKNVVELTFVLDLRPCLLAPSTPATSSERGTSQPVRLFGEKTCTDEERWPLHDSRVCFHSYFIFLSLVPLA